MWFKKQRSFEFFAIVVICLLALVLRLWGLNNKEFWYDEAYTGIMVKLPVEKLGELLVFDVHPPVYIYTLRLWTSLLGDSDLNIRLFSVLAGVLVVVSSYLLVKSLVLSKKYPFAKLAIPLIIAVIIPAGRAKRINITMDTSLLQSLDEIAELQHKSRSALLAEAL